MQDAEALERIAYELVETKAADNVRYVEVRWGPLLHVARGLSLADGIAAVVRGTRAAADRFGVTATLIATALRSHDPADNVAGRDRSRVPLNGARRVRISRARRRRSRIRSSTRVPSRRRDQAG